MLGRDEPGMFWTVCAVVIVKRFTRTVCGLPTLKTLK